MLANRLKQFLEISKLQKKLIKYAIRQKFHRKFFLFKRNCAQITQLCIIFWFLWYY